MFTRSCYGLMLGLLVFGLAAGLTPVGPRALSSAVDAADDGHAESEAPHDGAGHDVKDEANGMLHGDATEKMEDPSDFKSDLAIYTFVVFVLLLTILWKFAWGPIMDGLAKREQSIADTIDAATQSAEDAQKQLQAYQTQLASAADEVRDLLDKARRDAEVQKQEIVTQAQETAKFEKDRAVKEITAAKNQALAELARESVDTAVGLAGKIIRRQLNAADHTQLIEESLRRFPSEN